MSDRNDRASGEACPKCGGCGIINLPKGPNGEVPRGIIICDCKKSPQQEYESMSKPLTTDDLIRMGHQWECCSVRLEQSMSADAIDEALNNLGRDRWELVAVISNLYHFKRKLLP